MYETYQLMIAEAIDANSKRVKTSIDSKFASLPAEKKEKYISPAQVKDYQFDEQTLHVTTTYGHAFDINILCGIDRISHIMMDQGLEFEVGEAARKQLNAERAEIEARLELNLPDKNVVKAELERLAKAGVDVSELIATAQASSGSKRASKAGA